VMVKEFWRSVRIWQSYGKKLSGTFFSGHGVVCQQPVRRQDDRIATASTRAFIRRVVTEKCLVSELVVSRTSMKPESPPGSSDHSRKIC